MIRTDRRYRFSEQPAALWAVVTRCEDYRTWWPWLTAFEADGFHEGARWTCEVDPPAPWTLRFTVTLDDVDEGTAVFAHVDGDIEGTASIHVAAEATGSSIRLVADLQPASSLLRAVAVVARPLVVWTHDWVLDQGIRQLRERGLPAEPEGDDR